MSANSKRFIEELIARVRRAGAAGRLTVRVDSDLLSGLLSNGGRVRALGDFCLPAGGVVAFGYTHVLGYHPAIAAAIPLVLVLTAMCSGRRAGSMWRSCPSTRTLRGVHHERKWPTDYTPNRAARE